MSIENLRLPMEAIGLRVADQDETLFRVESVGRMEPDEEDGRKRLVELIVRAVNCHDAMVSALESAMRTYESMLPGTDIYNATMAGRCAVIAALDKAKGGTP